MNETDAIKTGLALVQGSGFALFAFAVWVEVRAIRRDLMDYVFRKGQNAESRAV